jgi:osmotically-inducible protein OsmY
MTRIWFLSVATVGLIVGGTRAMAGETSAATDAQQKQEIQQQLQKEPDLKNDHIAVKVDDGIAVLEGTVDSKREKKEAQEVAHVEGILGVNNRLQVRGAEK